MIAICQCWLWTARCQGVGTLQQLELGPPMLVATVIIENLLLLLLFELLHKSKLFTANF